MSKAAATMLAAMILAAALFPAAAGGADTEGAVNFRWAFVAVTAEDRGRQVVPIAKDTVLSTGDRFKLFVAPEKGTFVYLIYQSSQRQIHLLYPQGARDQDRAGSFPSAVIPPGGQWFELDAQPGEEVFTLIAADRRLTTLETVLHRHETAAAASEQSATAARVQDEIRRLRWENRGFKTLAERPTAVMGQLRGVHKPPKKDPAPVDITDHVIRIEAQGFYSRTFTIDHRR